MQTFETPESISSTIDVVVADVTVTAGDRTDTVVRVSPSDPGNKLDVSAAEQTRVTYDGGQLLVKGPRQRGLGIFGKIGSIHLTVDLPTGSDLQVDIGVGAFSSAGRVGECRIKTGAGDVQLDETAALVVNTGAGQVSAHRVGGDAEVTTATGRVRLGEVAGTAVVKNANGDSSIGEVAGDVRVNAANGTVAVGVAHAGVTAHTANGNVRVDQLRAGSASLKTAMGAIEIGVPAGTAARLDVSTRFGRVYNHLDASAGPQPSERTAEVRARTGFGDITIRRS
jgi:DUF4097 and DUF4098 domain-containing protein YvlB